MRMNRLEHLLRNDRFATSLSGRPLQLTIVICAIWLLIGLTGHDPWKSDEAYTVGAVYRMLETGDWVVPRIGDTPFLKTPPLVHYGAAVSAVVFSPILPLHDAARLSVGFWTSLLLLFTALTARELWGGNRTWIAPLMLIGCTGLLVRGHQLISEVVLLAALAIGIYGLALAPRRSQIGGVWLGAGLGLAFLASGLLDPFMLVLATIGMVIVSPRYRTARFAKSILTATAIATPLILAWPLALHSNDPALFSQWLSQSLASAGELFKLRANERHFYFLDVLPWFTWPLWPFALWSLWIEGREGLAKRELQVPLVAFIAIFGYLSLAGQGRDVIAMPMLLPLALMASIALGQLPRGAVNAYYWFGIMILSVFSLVAWVYFSAVQYGVPGELADHMLSLQPAYQPETRAISIIVAIIFTILWPILVFNIKRSPERPVILWAAGMTVGWALAAFLLFHWIDARRTYRTVAVEMSATLPEQYQCIISQDVGDSQLAMLDYFGGITTTRVVRRECDVLITQDRWGDDTAIGPPWALQWEGGRPGDRDERYRLYTRPDGR
jgi:4-amino-4-deoxy-L-arabinose transferase-like glycosyltransferase